METHRKSKLHGMFDNEDIKEDIRNYISKNILYEDYGENYSDGDSLLDAGILDSLGVMELAAFIEDHFDLRVRAEHIVPDNFESVEKLASYVDRELDKKAQ